MYGDGRLVLVSGQRLDLIVAAAVPLPGFPATWQGSHCRELRSGKSKAEALRMAQLSFVRRVETTKPIHWAAFHLMGEGANSLERMKDDNSRTN